ncbi:MFS transporter [Devosia submarina]|uniref:MFS transporter n=1 Tax=Devosia submarina TaxID=1173082 RepID=UPI000D373F05|nr:MFS transporter [Devosia submarina]
MSLPLLALFLAAFAFGTAEFVIAGVLPDVATGLGITIPVAGYLVTGYAIGIAIGGPLLAVATKKLSRKALILLLGSVFTLGQVLCALAPNFELLLAARILVSVMHGTYFGIAAIVAVSLVPKERRGFAVALILSGLTISNILGVPGGTAVGNMFGWRASFWAVGALSLVATIAIALFLPTRAGEASTSGSFRREFKALGRQQIVSSLIIAILAMIAQYSVFTYIAPLLIEVTGLDPMVVPWVLLLYGVGSTVGVFIGGRLADWKIMPSVIGILVCQVLAFALLYLATPHPLLMAVTVIIWGGVNFAVGTPIQARVLATAGDAPNLASALIPTGYNIGIAIGAMIGAAAIEGGASYGSLPLIGVGCLVAATLVAILSYWAELRTAPPLGRPAE